jgi:hypothetical protein
MHEVEALVPEHNFVEVEIAIEKPGTYQIMGELIQAGGKTFLYEVHKYIYSILNNEGLLQQQNAFIILLIYKMGETTDSSNEQGVSVLSTLYKILYNILLSRFNSMHR